MYKTPLFILLFSATLFGQSRESLLKQIHADPAWTAIGEAVHYDAGNVEKFVGKQAQALIHYGVTGITVQDWKASGHVHLVLYEMTDASAAYGLFTTERSAIGLDADPIPIGAEGFHRGSSVCFWQSKYVVKLEGELEGAKALGRLVSTNILGQSEKPPVAEMLPPNGLIYGSERYVLNGDEVDRRLGLDVSQLGFDDDVEMAAANYRIDGKPASLVLLLYPTQQVAKKYADQMDAKSPEPGFRKRSGGLIAIVRGTSDASTAKSVLDLVNYETQVTWNEPKPGLTMGQIIITAFIFIGIALLFTIVAGVGFGGLRIFVKRRFPDRVFDRAADMEIIQLKLIQEVTRKELVK